MWRKMKTLPHLVGLVLGELAGPGEHRLDGAWGGQVVVVETD